MLRKILFPTDFSEDSIRVKNTLKKISNCDISEIILFHIMNEKILGYSELIDGFSFGSLKIDKEIHARINRKLNKCKEELEKKGLKVSTKILTGTPFTTILSYAKEQNVSSIFLGHKGHRKLEELLMSSTSEKIARKSDITVVLI